MYMCVHMCSVHMQMVECLSKNVSPMIMQIAGGGGIQQIRVWQREGGKFAILLSAQ